MRRPIIAKHTGAGNLNHACAWVNDSPVLSSRMLDKPPSYRDGNDYCQKKKGLPLIFILLVFNFLPLTDDFISAFFGRRKLGFDIGANRF
jgi:hypothetical protein